MLVGGASRRMGRDKASLLLAGLPMAERVARSLETVAGTVHFVGGTVAPRFGSRPWLPDLHPGDGPLAGIHAALSASTSGRVLVVGCDLPFVAPSLLEALDGLLTPELDAVVPTGDRGPVPVCAAYRSRAASEASARLRRGQRSAQAFVAALRCRYLSAGELAELDPTGESLRNINTPDDLRRAERLSGEPKGLP